MIGKLEILYWLLVGSIAITSVMLYFYSSTAFLDSSLLLMALILLRSYDHSINDRPHIY